ADATAGAGRRGIHGAGQRLAAFPRFEGDGALVRRRQFLVALAGAGADRADRVRAVARRDGRGARCAAVRAELVLLRAGLRRPGAGDVALPGTALDDTMGGSRAAIVAGLHAGRRGGAAAGDPGLYGVVVPGVPRQDRGGAGLP